jgi:hypothetical protein
VINIFTLASETRPKEKKGRDLKAPTKTVISRLTKKKNCNILLYYGDIYIEDTDRRARRSPLNKECPKIWREAMV